jgi:hypothetical protein
MNPFDAWHPDTASNNRNPVRPRSDTVDHQGCQLCMGKHRLKKCNQSIERNLMKRIRTCKERGTCFKCLGNKPHVWTLCESDTQCTECTSRNHHNLWHGISRSMVMETTNANRANNS